MSPSLSELLKLLAGERAELAMALWASLSNAERGAELELTLSKPRNWTGAGSNTFSDLSPRFHGTMFAAG